MDMDITVKQDVEFGRVEDRSMPFFHGGVRRLLFIEVRGTYWEFKIKRLGSMGIIKYTDGFNNFSRFLNYIRDYSVVWCGGQVIFFINPSRGMISYFEHLFYHLSGVNYCMYVQDSCKETITEKTLSYNPNVLHPPSHGVQVGVIPGIPFFFVLPRPPICADDLPSVTLHSHLQLASSLRF